MLTWLRLPALAALCCCLIACMTGATPANSAAPATSSIAVPPATTDAWQVRLIMSGGIAGREEHFTANGASTALLVTDAIRGTGATIALTAAQKQELGQAVTSRSHAPDIESLSSSCRDCYQFQMEISAGPSGKQRRVRLDSVTMDSSADASLIERILSLARTGTGQPTP